MNYENMDKKQLIEILRDRESILKKLYLEKEKLKYYASTDGMTGVLNRRVGLKLLNKEFSLSKSSNESIVVCFADVDKLKIINDKFGHKEGDRVLKFVAQTLKENIRKDDFVIRMGGDEFLIVFPRTTKRDIYYILNRIYKKIKEFNLKEYKYNLSLSYGFSEYKLNEAKDLTLNEVIHKADKKMYKRKLKNKFLYEKRIKDKNPQV
ncbi:GGDEF domain-containing protein [Clostridium novyi]|uniref:GGDEF domain-containing protein n=1 Tax=Clostridium novyi TaxID=1542 RepID=UPI0006905C48|nr:GGDEF domain-containing protein [Clostridium novyi]